MSSRNEHEKKLQKTRERIQPMINKEKRNQTMKNKIVMYYRQLQKNEPIGRLEREKWEESQRNINNKVPEALKALEAAKVAQRTGLKIASPRLKWRRSNKAQVESKVASEAPVSVNKTVLNKLRNATKKALMMLKNKTKKNPRY